MRAIAAWIGAEPCMEAGGSRAANREGRFRRTEFTVRSVGIAIRDGGLQRGGSDPTLSHARRSDGRSPVGRRVGRREESPGSTEARCRVTPGGGDSRESATETHRRARRSAPSHPASGRAGDGTEWAVRVKWCGKSAPRRRQRRRQGKPHREQDQVGAAGGVPAYGLGTPPGGPAAPPLGSVARGVR
jgi:hypothetical protein